MSFAVARSSPASPTSDAAKAPGARARASTAITEQAAVRMKPGVTGSFPAARRELPLASAWAAEFVKRQRCAWTLENGRFGVGAEDPLERLDDLALGGMRPGAVEQRLHQVAVRGRCLTQLGERALDRLGVAARAHRLNAADLLALELLRDAEDRELAVVLLLVAVHAHDHALPTLDLLLEPEARLGDLALRVALLDRLDHPAELVDLLELGIGRLLEPVRERLHEIGAAERVDRVRDPGLVRDDL